VPFDKKPAIKMGSMNMTAFINEVMKESDSSSESVSRSAEGVS
jgi:hypothetical protein